QVIHRVCSIGFFLEGRARPRTQPTKKAKPSKNPSDHQRHHIRSSSWYDTGRRGCLPDHSLSPIRRRTEPNRTATNGSTMHRALSLVAVVVFAGAQATGPDPVRPDPESPRPIAALDTVFLEEMTWMEVRDAMRAGKDTVIVPTGGIEQNGP